MLTFILISVIVVMLGCLGFAGYYLVRFARIIMSIEDSLSAGIEAFENSESSLENMLKMQMFFESREVQSAVKAAMDDIKLSKTAVAAITREFTRLSKQKYEMVRVVDDEIDDEEESTLGTERASR